MSKKQPLYPHVTKSRKKPGTEELKSWGELTLQEKLAYARRVVGSGIPGWDNMKAIAYEMGIEPDEDEIPTLFELGKMVGGIVPGKLNKPIALEYQQGQLIRVGDIMVQTAIIGREWVVDYIEVPPTEKAAYRDALLKARIKIIKVLSEHIYFE